MRITTAGFVAIALMVSTSAEAQRGMGGMGRRGGMGGRGGNRGDGTNRGTEMNFPAASDLQRFNPAQLMIDKRKKLSLADSQVSSLTALRTGIYERNADVLARYDSIRKNFHPPKPEDRSRTGSTPETDSVRIVSLNQMRLLRQLLDTLTTRRTADVEDVLTFLTDEKQHRAAVELLNDQDRDFTDRLPRAALGRGGRRGGAPRPDGGTTPANTSPLAPAIYFLSNTLSK